jgi:hypothetical protein
MMMMVVVVVVVVVMMMMMMMMGHDGCTNLRRLVAQGSTFCTLSSTRNVLSIIIANIFCIHKKKCKLPSKKHQITVRFTGHSRFVSPQYGNYFMLL